MHIAFAGEGSTPAEPSRLSAVRPAAVIEWLVRRDEAVRSRARLNAMSDHMLKDIGITRNEIDEALRGNIGRS
jgi:uncharacterized protein YjiS (DUF1127 family)